MPLRNGTRELPLLSNYLPTEPPHRAGFFACRNVSLQLSLSSKYLLHKNKPRRPEHRQSNGEPIGDELYSRYFQVKSVGTCLAWMALEKKLKFLFVALRNEVCENSTKKRKEYIKSNFSRQFSWKPNEHAEPSHKSSSNR